jgi:hypothetical protein
VQRQVQVPVPVTRQVHVDVPVPVDHPVEQLVHSVRDVHVPVHQPMMMQPMTAPMPTMGLGYGSTLGTTMPVGGFGMPGVSGFGGF